MNTAQKAILIALAILLVYGWLVWAIRSFREMNLRIGRFFFSLLPEKMQIVFTIPELRRKIFFTLGLLAIYRVGWQIPLPVIDPSKAGTPGSEGGLGGFLQQVSLFSASNLQPVDDLRPGHHALYLGLDHSCSSWAASIRRWRSCERKAKRAARRSTNTPAT